MTDAETNSAQPDGQESTPHYWAFISYSHADERWGRWLHKALERYRVPRRVADDASDDTPTPRRLKPIFRDKEELSTSADLPGRILDALERSRHLVVICSPRARKSPWVDREIRQFKALGKADQVFCLIVDGEPNASDGGEPEIEAFPISVRFVVDDGGDLTEERTEPLAADVRKGKDTKRDACLRLIAGLLDLDFDALRRRDQRRRTRWLTAWMSTAGGVIVALTVLTILTLIARGEADEQTAIAGQQRKVAVRQRNEAVNQRGIAERRAETIRQELAINLIALADSELRNGNAGGVRPLLADVPADLRGWDWHRLWHDGDVSAATHVSESDYDLLAVACTRDGKLVAVGDRWGSIRLRERVTGKLVATFGRPPPASDIPMHRRRVMPFEPFGVSALAFSPNGAQLVSGDREGNLRIWNVADQQRVAEVKGSRLAITHVAFFGERQNTIAYSGADQHTRIWHPATERLHSFGSMNARVSALDVSADGRSLVTVAGNQGRLVMPPYQEAVELSLPFFNSFTSAAISPDGEFVCTGHEDGAVYLWNKTGRLGKLAFGHKGAVTAMAFIKSPLTHGQVVVSAGQDKVLKAWSIGADRKGILFSLRNVATLHGHAQPIVGLAGALSQDVFVTCAADRTIKSWSVQPQLGAEYLRGVTQAIVGVTPFSLSPDGRTYAVYRRASGGTSVNVHNLKTGKLEHDIKATLGDFKRTESNPFKGDWDLHALRFSPDGKQIAASLEDGAVRVWSLADGKLLHTLTSEANRDGRRPFVTALAYSRDSQHLFTADVEGRLHKWDLTTSERTWTIDGHRDDQLRFMVTQSHVESLEVSPDNTMLVSAGLDPTVRVWDAESGEPIAALTGHDKPIHRAVFTPDNEFIVSGSSDNTARVWSIADRKTVTILTGHTEPVTDVAIDPDQTRIATTSRDKSLRIWTMNGRLMTTLNADGADLRVAFDPNGQLISSGRARTRLWPAAWPSEDEVKKYRVAAD